MRHIPTTWQQLYVDDRPRMWALCGAKSSPPGCGIPSITRESPGGWCESCINLLIEQLNSVDMALLTPGIMFYYDAINAEATRCTTGEITRYPLWHKYSESFNNRLFVIWSVMMDRCYDPSNPDYQAWGHRVCKWLQNGGTSSSLSMMCPMGSPAFSHWTARWWVQTTPNTPIDVQIVHHKWSVR